MRGLIHEERLQDIIRKFRSERAYEERDMRNDILDVNDIRVGEAHTTNDLIGNVRHRKRFNRNVETLLEVLVENTFLSFHEARCDVVRRWELKDVQELVEIRFNNSIVELLEERSQIRFHVILLLRLREISIVSEYPEVNRFLRWIEFLQCFSL